MSNAESLNREEVKQCYQRFPYCIQRGGSAVFLQSASMHLGLLAYLRLKYSPNLFAASLAVLRKGPLINEGNELHDSFMITRLCTNFCVPD